MNRVCEKTKRSFFFFLRSLRWLGAGPRPDIYNKTKHFLIAYKPATSVHRLFHLMIMDPGTFLTALQDDGIRGLIHSPCAACLLSAIPRFEVMMCKPREEPWRALALCFCGVSLGLRPEIACS